jgi:hypothetical protein
MDFKTPDPPITRGSTSLSRLKRPGPDATDREFIHYFADMAVLLEDRCRTMTFRSRWWIVTVINSTIALLIVIWLVCMHAGRCR